MRPRISVRGSVRPSVRHASIKNKGNQYFRPNKSVSAIISSTWGVLRTHQWPYRPCMLMTLFPFRSNVVIPLYFFCRWHGSYFSISIFGWWHGWFGISWCEWLFRCTGRCVLNQLMTHCKEAKFLCFTGSWNFFFKNLLFLLFLGHLGSERPQEKKWMQNLCFFKNWKKCSVV